MMDRQNRQKYLSLYYCNFIIERSPYAQRIISASDLIYGCIPLTQILCSFMMLRYYKMSLMLDEDE